MIPVSFRIWSCGVIKCVHTTLVREPVGEKSEIRNLVANLGHERLKVRADELRAACHRLACGDGTSEYLL